MTMEGNNSSEAVTPPTPAPTCRAPLLCWPQPQAGFVNLKEHQHQQAPCTKRSLSQDGCGLPGATGLKGHRDGPVGAGGRPFLQAHLKAVGQSLAPPAELTQQLHPKKTVG